MFCIDCKHPTVFDGEKALSGEIQMVRRSTLSDEWVCEVTGNEHRTGDMIDYVRHVHTTLPKIFAFADEGTISAEQALELIKIELGFKQRSEQSQRVGRLIESLEKGDLSPVALQVALQDHDD